MALTKRAAYELAIQQRVKYVQDILQALLTARKRVCDVIHWVFLQYISRVSQEMG